MAKILIDRGHSYSAQGSVGYVQETELTHRWGDRLAVKLAERGADFVVLPDGGTASQDLEVPVKAANAYGKDSVFLSIHCNAFSNAEANGSEIFVYTGAYSGKTKDLAESVYGAYRSVVPDLTNRGIKQADYYVLRKTVMPATLLELGFVTNSHDAVVISDEQVIDKGCAAIADALMVVAGQSVKPPAKPVLPEGYYIITSKENGKALDLNKTTGEICIYDCHRGSNQQWIYVNGFFKSVENGLVMDIEGGSNKSGARVIAYQATAGSNQKFVVDVDGHIITHSGLCFDVAGGSDANGSIVIQYPITGGTNQMWNFERLVK